MTAMMRNRSFMIPWPRLLVGVRVLGGGREGVEAVCVKAPPHRVYPPAHLARRGKFTRRPHTEKGRSLTSSITIPAITHPLGGMRVNRL